MSGSYGAQAFEPSSLVHSSHMMPDFGQALLRPEMGDRHFESGFSASYQQQQLHQHMVHQQYVQQQHQQQQPVYWHSPGTHARHIHAAAAVSSPLYTSMMAGSYEDSQGRIAQVPAVYQQYIPPRTLVRQDPMPTLRAGVTMSYSAPMPSFATPAVPTTGRPFDTSLFIHEEQGSRSKLPPKSRNASNTSLADSSTDSVNGQAQAVDSDPFFAVDDLDDELEL